MQNAIPHCNLTESSPMNAKHLIAIAAIAFAGAASAQSHSQEDYVGTLPVSLSLMSRAEVIADLNLWNRAGLRASHMGEHSGMDDALHAQRLATYQRLRSGPEYRAEVRRLQGGSAVAGVPAASNVN